jgi:hypothetical protein
MSRPTLSELEQVWRDAGGSRYLFSVQRGLAAVLRRLADECVGLPCDIGPNSLACWLRGIAAEADPPKPEPDTKTLKAAALEVRDESDATMRHIKAMNAAMDAVLEALDGTMTYHGQPLRWERGKR